MKMRPKQAFQPSGKLSVWLVAIAPSSDFVWSSAPETMLGAFCAKPSSPAKCSVRGRGIVIDEPSLVAVDSNTGEVIAIGIEAQQMSGREARDVTVIAPLLDGVVADFERTKLMLAHFVRKARGGKSYFSRRAMMSVLSGVTQVEQRALFNAAEQAGMGRVCMIEKCLAAALGAGVKIDDTRASAVVDIGGWSPTARPFSPRARVPARSRRKWNWRASWTRTWC